MEAGGLIAGVSWTEFDFLLQGEAESDIIMAQLLGGEGADQELLPWSNQAASSAYCDSSTGCISLAVPASYEGYNYLSNSSNEEALGISSSRVAVPGDLGLVQDQTAAAAEFLNAFSNHSHINGNGSLKQVDIDDFFDTSIVDKRKHLAEELDGETRGRKRGARKGETTKGVTKRAKQSGGDEDDADNIPMITSGSPTSCCTSDSSEDSTNASQDHQESAHAEEARPKKAKKARVGGRGAASTEPQSIYARKRRERINERLKILQNLVPNGTKVDISTMLEEAVHYVKFLQLQIKLLSSDDTWMYAPIAYNGMNIGIDLNMER